MTSKKQTLYRDRFPLALRVGLSLGIFLISGNVAGIATQANASQGEASQESPDTTSQDTENAPLGLELWLSGEEPGGTEAAVEDPLLEVLPEATAPDRSAESTLDPVQMGTPNPQTLSQGDEAPSAPTVNPTVVLEERASGCTVELNGDGAVVSSDRACSGEILTGEALGNTLEQQWQYWYGDTAHSDTTAEPASPLQVGVQAIGSAMQVSPFIEDYYFQTARPAPLASENDRRMLFPLKSWAPITSVFGWRSHPISQTWRLHTGTDLGAFWGTPVVAAFSGTVEVADVLDGYGVTVVLYHAQRNQQTLYAHLSEIFVKPGEFIAQGTVLGRVGSTGNSTGPHLHFELRELQDGGWVALDAGAELATASLGTEGESSLVAKASPALPPSLSQALKVPGSPASNALQQWITWFLQVLSNLA